MKSSRRFPSTAFSHVAMFCFVVLLRVSIARAGIVFDNTGLFAPIVWGPTCCQVGVEVELGGIQRTVNGLSWWIYGQAGQETADFQLRIYANDGVDGVPETVLWDSGIYNDVPVETGYQLMSFDVPLVDVPDRFTVTSRIYDSPLIVGRVTGSTPSIGTVHNSWWLSTSGAKISRDPSVYDYGVRIETLNVTLDLEIDINTGGGKAILNLNSKRNILVSLLATDAFDLSLVDLDSLTLGDPDLIAGGAIPSTSVRTRHRDLNRDGVPDLQVYFNTAKLVESGAVDANSEEAVLRGELVDGTTIIGYKSISTRSKSSSLTSDPAAIPEPSTFYLIALGGLILGVRRGRGKP